MISHIVIGIAYFIIASGILSALRSQSAEFIDRTVKLASIVFLCVFVFCGSHYLLEVFAPSIDVLLRNFILAPFAVAGALICNPFTIAYKHELIQKYFAPIKKIEKSEEAFDSIYRSTINNMVLVRLDEPYKKLTVIRYSRSFYAWYQQVSELEEIPEDLTGLNWYDLFPLLEERWKEDHVKAVEKKIVLSKRQEHWSEKGLFLDWAIEPTQGNYLYFFFDDVTKLVEQVKKNEDQLQLYKDASIALLSNPNSELNKLMRRNLDGNK